MRRACRRAWLALLERIAGPRPHPNYAFVEQLERAIWEARAVTEEELELAARGRIIDGISLFDDYRIRRSTEALARSAGLSDDQAAELAAAWSLLPAPAPRPLPAWDFGGHVRLERLGE